MITRLKDTNDHPFEQQNEKWDTLQSRDLHTCNCGLQDGDWAYVSVYLKKMAETDGRSGCSVCC